MSRSAGPGPCPSGSTSVTLIKDPADRYFASFVVEVNLSPLPETDGECGIDLGLGHFAVMDDGTKVSSPRFLRRAEKKLKRAQRDMPVSSQLNRPRSGHVELLGGGQRDYFA